MYFLSLWLLNDLRNTIVIHNKINSLNNYFVNKILKYQLDLLYKIKK
jgi:hypothetical protein